MTEADYYKKTSEIQREFIIGNVTRKELEQELEVLRLQYIGYLEQRNKDLITRNFLDIQTEHIINRITRNQTK